MPHLLLVLPLCGEPGLYAQPGLHECLPLGHIAGVVGQHASQVGTQEQHRVPAHLDTVLLSAKIKLNYR